MQILSPGNIVEFHVGVENGNDYPYMFQAKVISYDIEENTAVVETNDGEQTLDMQETNYGYALVRRADDAVEVDSILESLTPEQLQQLKERFDSNASNE